MHKPPVITRPTFDQALRAWQGVLQERKLPQESLWLFAENLCFEPASKDKGERIAFQTAFTPAPPNAERIAYDYFTQFERPVVFYRIGSAQNKSLSLILCDAWFEHHADGSDYVKREEWFMLFHPGSEEQLEEIKDPERWKRHSVRKGEVQALDFCMSLRSVHEMLAHGHVLSPYEHYALRFLHAWHEFLPRKNRLDN